MSRLFARYSYRRTCALSSGTPLRLHVVPCREYAQPFFAFGSSSYHDYLPVAPIVAPVPYRRALLFVGTSFPVGSTCRRFSPLALGIRGVIRPKGRGVKSLLGSCSFVVPRLFARYSYRRLVVPRLFARYSYRRTYALSSGTPLRRHVFSLRKYVPPFFYGAWKEYSLFD